PRLSLLHRRPPISDDLFRRSHSARKSAREPHLKVSSLGAVRGSAARDPVSDLRPTILAVHGLSRSAAAGDRLLLADEAQRGGRHIYRSADRAGSGFSVEESARFIRHRKNLGGLLRGVGGIAIRRGPSFHTAAPGFFLLLFSPVLHLGALSGAARTTGQFRPAADGG